MVATTIRSWYISQVHDYAVLECEDLTSEGRRKEYMDTDLLGAIHRSLSQSARKLQNVLVRLTKRIHFHLIYIVVVVVVFVLF